MIPLELLTMGASAVVGGVLKIMDRKADREDRLLDKVQGERKAIRSTVNPQLQWTRRTIALTVVFAVMVLPKLAALAGYPVYFGIQQQSSFLWGLFQSGAGIELYRVGGMPILPLDTHTLAAVIGLYFGGGRSR